MKKAIEFIESTVKGLMFVQAHKPGRSKEAKKETLALMDSLVEAVVVLKEYEKRHNA